MPPREMNDEIAAGRQLFDEAAASAISTGLTELLPKLEAVARGDEDSAAPGQEVSIHAWSGLVSDQLRWTADSFSIAWLLGQGELCLRLIQRMATLIEVERATPRDGKDATPEVAAARNGLLNHLHAAIADADIMESMAEAFHGPHPDGPRAVRSLAVALGLDPARRDPIVIMREAMQALGGWFWDECIAVAFDEHMLGRLRGVALDCVDKRDSQPFRHLYSDVCRAYELIYPAGDASYETQSAELILARRSGYPLDPSLFLELVDGGAIEEIGSGRMGRAHLRPFLVKGVMRDWVVKKLAEDPQR